jgi:drug/metabolite transporter superfamily protein YnfA
MALAEGEQKPVISNCRGSRADTLWRAVPTLQPTHFGRVYAAYHGCSLSCPSSGMEGGRNSPGQV